MRCTTIVLLSGFLSIAQANDITFYPSSVCDQGVYNGCYNFPPNSCCTGSPEGILAISISKGPYDFAIMYAGGGCKTEVCVRVQVLEYCRYN